MKLDGAALTLTLLADGTRVRTVAVGSSMWPIIRQGDTICIEPVTVGDVKVGDIVVFKRAKHLVAHRLVRVSSKAAAEELAHSLEGSRDEFLLFTKGDSFTLVDNPVTAGDLVGRVYAVERKGRTLPLRKGIGWLLNKVAFSLSPLTVFLLNRRRAQR